MDSQYKLLSELLSDQAAFITSPKTSLANYWGGHCPPVSTGLGDMNTNCNLTSGWHYLMILLMLCLTQKLYCPKKRKAEQKMLFIICSTRHFIFFIINFFVKKNPNYLIN